MRKIYVIAVLAVWLFLIAVLVRRQQAPPDAPMLVAEVPQAEGAETRDQWFGIYQKGRKIGWAHRTTSHGPDGFAFRDDSDFRLAMLGSEQRVQTSVFAETDSSFALRQFRLRLVSPAATFTASGSVEPERLLVRHSAGGDERELVIPLSEPIHLPTTLRSRLDLTAAEPGAKFSATVFSPLTLKNERMSVEIEGRETIDGPDGPVETVRVAEEQQGIKARAWIAPDGSVLREEATLGFRLEREAPEVAVAGVEGAPVDLATESRIPLKGRIESPREAQSLTLRVSGEAAGEIPDDPPRQRMSPGLLVIEREAALTADDTKQEPPSEEYTQPAPFIESDDPEIAALARQIAGDEKDNAVVAQKLVDWVASNLEQEPSVTIPSARAVLTSKRGDCNEHAVLLAALARAAGIPARVIAGAVYSEDGFYYHAWNELWLGRWISADAIFRQLPADATHVKLLEGGPERHLEIADVVGRLEFSSVEAPS